MMIEERKKEVSFSPLFSLSLSLSLALEKPKKLLPSLRKIK